MTGHRDVSIDEVKQGLADGSILLVDVREPHEFAAARIPGAINLPLSTFDPAEIAARPGQRVVFSCRSGVRSLRALDASLMAGFDYDAHYPGGMLGWVTAGEPVEAG
ncbi:MAG: rhodanese-like domain-containing protein [Hyphomicrobiales bacterium]